MAKDDAEEATFAPTQKKLMDLRRDGQVAHSQDFTGTVTLLLVMGYVVITRSDIFQKLQLAMASVPYATPVTFVEKVSMSGTLMMKIGVQIVTPILALTLMGSVIATIIDSGGFIFSTKSLTPNFSKFNPAEGLKKMFTLRNLIELIKGLAKIIILFVCVYLIIRRYSNDTFWSPTCGVGCVAGVTLVITGWIVAIGIMILLVSASLDLLISRWLFKRDNMMTLTEVKREQKEQFGDPHVRSARRADRQRMAQAAPLIGFNKATLIMVGAGGAVAITYKPEILGVPVISAKTSAEGIADFRTRAAERGLPVIEDAETVAELLKGGSVGDPIPRSTFTSVARALLRAGAGK